MQAHLAHYLSSFLSPWVQFAEARVFFFAAKEEKMSLYMILTCRDGHQWLFPTQDSADWGSSNSYKEWTLPGVCVCVGGGGRGFAV